MKDREIPVFHDFFTDQLPGLLAQMGLAPDQVHWAAALAGTGLVALALWLLAVALSKVFNLFLRRVAARTDTQFDDHLARRRLPNLLGRVVPLIIGFRLIPSVLDGYPHLVPVLEHLFTVFFIVLVIRILRAVMQAARDTLHGKPEYSGKPLDSYVQVGSLVLYIMGGLAIFSQLTGQSILTFLAAMGAASAVLLLVFKDTILGFVASIQISANNMVHVGDWIAMPKYGADGNVEEINLTTVKVRNFDKTVTMVPTYALISDSFQNYRAMEEDGGRRVKRNIRIKMSSIRFLAPDELEHLRGVELLTDFIAEKQREIEDYNAHHRVDKSLPLNGRNQTNIGLFRKYMELYTLGHEGIRQDMTRTVRHLQPDEYGLPLELYCFSSDVNFLGYEKLQADLFDHLLAAAPAFGLEVFEKPSSDDLRHFAAQIAAKP